MASADNSAVASARETYVRCVHELFLQYDELERRLAQVESSSQSANSKLSDVYDTLEFHLEQAKIASTAGDATSIVGEILLFTPAAALGIGLSLAGTATSVGTSIAQTFIFEKDAVEEFAKVMTGSTSSFDALQRIFHEIEVTKDKLSQSFEDFLVKLHTHSLPDLGAGSSPDVPSPAPKGPDNPKTPHTPNQFSLVLLQGLVNTAAAGKPLTDVSIKTGTELSGLLRKTARSLCFLK